MRPLLMCAGVGLVLGLALPSALAQEAEFRRGEAVETGFPTEDGGSRFVTINRQRELEHERLKLEGERRGLDQLPLIFVPFDVGGGEGGHRG